MTENSALRAGIGFPGQGPHEPEKMRRLIADFPLAADLLEEAEDTLARPLAHLLSSHREKYSSTRENQVRHYLGSSLLWEVAESEGVVPDSYERVVFGSSAGEIAAMKAAGVYSFAEGLHIIDTRGDEMHKASIINPGGMLIALGISFEEAEKLADQFPGVYAVNKNPGMQAVFSGARAGIDALLEYFEEVRVKAIKPEIPEAAHTWHMSPSIPEVRKAVQRVAFHKPSSRFIGNQAKFIEKPRELREHIVRQLTGRVLLADCVDILYHDQQVRTYVDVGQGTVLNNQIKRHFRHADEPIQLISIVEALLPERA